MEGENGSTGWNLCSDPMMHLFINALAASAGGGLTYIRNVIPHLASNLDVRVTVALPPQLGREFRSISNIKFLELEIPAARRFWFEQSQLPAVIRHSGANVLLSAGNFALRRSPVPQILLSRNSIYTSADFYRDLLSRHEYRNWIDTRFRAMLAKKSIQWADVTVAPSEAFAADLTRWTGKPVSAIHHGFDRDIFTRDESPLTADLEEKLRADDNSVRLLFVSHYNYYRNFETLIRALPSLRDRLRGKSVKLLLTCKLALGENPGSYRPEAAAKLAREIGVSDMLVELGSVPYCQLHQIYGRADIYVTPAYTETFSHPLVEAMSIGLPIVASDLPVHREICHDAALYFPRFSPDELTERVAKIDASAGLRARLTAAGKSRSMAFSWKEHVEKLLSEAAKLSGAPFGVPTPASKSRARSS